MIRNRREFLTGMAVFVGGMSAVASAQPPSPACYDPARLPLSQKNQRRSVGYVEPSPDAGKRCALCAFFTASQAGCGTCVMLTGGPVSETGLCTSFAAKKG